jgi:hypothetical protein
LPHDHDGRDPIVAGMMRTIREGGALLVPPILIDHRGELHDGRHRVSAHRLLGIETIRALIQQEPRPSTRATAPGRAMAGVYGETAVETAVADAWALAAVADVVSIAALRLALTGLPREILDAALYRMVWYGHARTTPDPQLRGERGPELGAYLNANWHHLVTWMLGHDSGPSK